MERSGISSGNRDFNLQKSKGYKAEGCKKCSFRQFHNSSILFVHNHSLPFLKCYRYHTQKLYTIQYPIFGIFKGTVRGVDSKLIGTVHPRHSQIALTALFRCCAANLLINLSVCVNCTYELSVYHWKIHLNCDRIYPKFDNKAVKHRGGIQNGI